MDNKKFIQVKVMPIEEAATPDLQNINKHTQRGRGLHENSMQKRGAGRSIFSAGKDVDVPVVMGGNQTFEIGETLGMEVINVYSDGTKIVNVVRTDIAPGSPEFYAMAIEDNAVANISYNPDIDILAAVMADPAMQALKAEDKMLADIVAGMTFSSQPYVGTDVPKIEGFEEPETAIRCIIEFENHEQEKEFYNLLGIKKKGEKVRYKFSEINIA